MWGGPTVTDRCDICGGDSTQCLDCGGTPKGNSSVDACGVCDVSIANDCKIDCASVWGGAATFTACGEAKTAVCGACPVIVQSTLPLDYTTIWSTVQLKEDFTAKFAQDMAALLGVEARHVAVPLKPQQYSFMISTRICAHPSLK